MRILLSLLPVVLIWSLIGGYLAQRHDVALAGATQDARNLGKAFEESIRRSVESIDTTIRAVRVTRAYDPLRFDLAQSERESGLARELTLQIALTDRDGLVIDSNLGKGGPPVSIADRVHFKATRDRTDDRLFISQPVVGRVSHKWSVQFVRRLYDQAGAFDGVIVASMDPAFLTRFYSSLEIGDATLLLLGHDGIVKAGASRTWSAPSQDLNGTALFEKARSADRGFFTTDDPLDHVNRIYSWRRVDPYDLIAVVGLSTNGALSDYRRHLYAGLAVGVILTIASLTVSAVLTGNRKAILRSQAVLQATVQNISQGLLVVDQQRNIPVINTRAAELLGLPPELARPGIKFDTILQWQVDNGEFQGQDAEQVRSLVKSGGIGATNSSYRRTRTNGLVLEFHTKVLDTGLAVRTITDITEQERNAKVLADSRDAAERAASARSEFLAVMSHEIRTPLNGVIGIAGLLEEMELGAAQRDYVRLISQSGDHLLMLINDILDYSRLEASRMDLEAIAFDPTDLVDGIVGMLGHQAAAKGLALTVAMSDKMPAAVVGDPGRLRQILINLVGNAIKFTDSGWVKLDLVTQQVEGARARLSFHVADSGIGIAPEAIARMFQEFTQADGSISRRYGGSGLGLAICRRLVELMGGQISVESKPGAGSIFRFNVTLPLGEAPPLHAALPDGQEANRTALRVLVAEDNPTNRIVALQLLERLGHNARAVENGAQALDAIRQAPCDLVLMDVMMPEMDGLTATRAIRAGGNLVPIVGLTAQSRPENLAACLEAGMDAVTTKPVTLASLRSAIAEGLARAKKVTTMPAMLSSRLEELKDTLGEDVVEEIIQAFAEDTGLQLRTIRQAAEAGQNEKVYRMAHGIAGAARNVGASVLAEHASALERDAGSLDTAGMISRIAIMEGDMEAALTALGVMPADATA